MSGLYVMQPLWTGSHMLATSGNFLSPWQLFGVPNVAKTARWEGRACTLGHELLLPLQDLVSVPVHAGSHLAACACKSASFAGHHLGSFGYNMSGFLPVAEARNQTASEV